MSLEGIYGDFITEIDSVVLVEDQQNISYRGNLPIPRDGIKFRFDVNNLTEETGTITFAGVIA